jgi:hypothetical protein
MMQAPGCTSTDRQSDERVVQYQQLALTPFQHLWATHPELLI